MQQHSFKRILIIATRQIGDTLITTPLIQRAKEIWPEAQIDFLGFEHAKDILHGNPYLHQIIGTSQKPTLQEYPKKYSFNMTWPSLHNPVIAPICSDSLLRLNASV